MGKLTLLLFLTLSPGTFASVQTPISCGETVTGALTSQTDIVEFTFTIPAGGDYLALNIGSTTPNFTPRFRLYDPDGSQIASDTNYATRTVTKVGTYRIAVSYNSGSVTSGGFKLSRQSIRNPCRTIQIECGGNPRGRLDEVSEIDAYIFNGTAGEEIKLQIGSSRVNDFNPQMFLYAPDGDSLGSSSTEIPRTLTQTGIHKLFVLQSTGSGRVGDYGLMLQNTRTPCNSLALGCGSVLYGSIDELAEFDTYTFTATANEPFMLWNVATTRDTASQTAGSYFNVEMELYGPNGQRITSGSREIRRTPAVTGQYTLIVHSATGDETGDYQISLQNLKNPCNALQLQPCLRLRSAISSQAEIDAYTIEGSVGDLLPVRVTGETTLFTPDAMFYDPDGVAISSGQPLAKTGRHTVIVRAQGGTGMTGNYTVSVGSSTITVTSPLSGEMLVAGEAHRIVWEASNTASGTTFDILLSVDGGATFPHTIAAGISRSTLFHDWTVPHDLVAGRARIRIVSNNASGSSCRSESAEDFFIVALGAVNTVEYKYDELNQLIEVKYDNGSKVTYTYDEVGNRLSETITGPPGTAAAVATTSATDITPVSAMLNGVVNPNSAATNFMFEWGLSPELAGASSTNTQNAGAGSENIQVSAVVGDLIPNTTYYFRLTSSNSGGTSRGSIISFRTTAARPATSVSAASYSGTVLAPESIAAVFGGGLATTVEIANTIPLPTLLAGTNLKFIDSAGRTQPAQLFFVAPGQINYLLPSGLAFGPATTVITSADGIVSSGTVNIAPVAPGLFSANADGQGVAAAVVLRVKADGTQIFEPVSRNDQATNRFVAAPIDFGPESDQIFLVAFGTGWRGRSDISAVSASIAGVDVQVLYAGAQGGLAGLDQINLALPRTLAGKGQSQILLVIDGSTANVVDILLK